MKLKANILVRMLTLLLTLTICSCQDNDNTAAGDPHFSIDGTGGHIIMDAAGTGMSALNSGIEYDIKARGNWELVPADGTETAWARVYPLRGADEGVIRIYTLPNDRTARRTATYNIVIDGVVQPDALIIDQDPAPANFRLSSDNVRINTAGGTALLTIDSNVEWSLDYDTGITWFSVERDGNAVKITAPGPNDSGKKRTATIYIRGLAPYEDQVIPITVTQLYAIFFEDFSWIPNTESPALCWISASNEARVDQWPSKFKNKVDDPSVLTAWSGMSTKDKKVLAYSSYNYIKLGSSTRTGNICTPPIASVNGEITAIASWNMAGFCKKTNERIDCKLFYAALLGPGTIVETTAGGKSDSWIEHGFEIPYNTSGSGNTGNTMLTQIAGFEIGPDGFFDTNETTGLAVWNSPDTQFSIKIEGMTSSTRIVFIAGEADKVTVLNDWLNSNGTFADSRKLFDNFIVEEY